MDEVTIRELRNEGGRVVERVTAGERLVVTRAGKPVAELHPVARLPLAAAILLANRRAMPPVDPDALRADVDAVLDASL